MADTEEHRKGSERYAPGLFTILILIVNLVMDGLPKLDSTVHVQLILLPITLFFLLIFSSFLAGDLLAFRTLSKLLVLCENPTVLLVSICFFEGMFIALFFYEARHFAMLGYKLSPVADGFAFTFIALSLIALTLTKRRISPSLQLVVFLGIYAIGQVLAIVSFPLNYLRSDMLPVIQGANQALLAGQNPYRSFYIADRLYDFPYLPGMLLAFAPAQALRLDPRWTTIAYLIAGMWLIYGATSKRYRPQVVLLLGLFVLCPYLQYRHDLYTQGHFFSLILVFVLMQRRRFAWSAIAFGVSMAISQFSWVIFPFFLMNGLRRGGWKEVSRMVVLALFAALLIWMPFLSSGVGTIAHNTVGQWDSLSRPMARPMNLAFWASYLVRPSHLKWIQLVLLIAVFCFCWFRGRCADLVDTLRWMLAALLIFILFNVLIDGYFYLMLLVPMLIYTCVANGWWATPETAAGNLSPQAAS